MIFFNIIALLVTLIIQLYHMKTLKDTLRYKNTYMYARLLKDEKIYKQALEDKIALLKSNRIILIITFIISILMLIFNNIPFITVLYLIIFIPLPYVFTHYKVANDIDDLNIANYLDEEKTLTTKYSGLFFNEQDAPAFISYGQKRAGVNISNFKGKIFVSFLFIFIIIVLILALFLSFSKSDPYTIISSTNTNQVEFKYETNQVSIPYDEIQSIEKIKQLPEIIDNINGIEQNQYLVGKFNLKGNENAILYVDKNAKTFLKIITNNQTYFFSDENQANSNTLYDTITKLMPKK